MSGHWEPPHADNDPHHHLNPHHGDHGDEHGDHGHDAHAKHDTNALSAKHDDHKSHADAHAKSDDKSATQTSKSQQSGRVTTPYQDDGLSSFRKGARLVYNSTAGAVVDTVHNAGHAVANTAVRATAGTLSGVRQTVKQTASEVKDNFATAGKKDKRYKRRAWYIGSLLSTPGIVLEWWVRVLTEPVNTVKGVIDITANAVWHQAETIKSMGTSQAIWQVNAHRTRETRKQPARWKQNYRLNPRHRYNKINSRWSGWSHK